MQSKQVKPVIHIRNSTGTQQTGAKRIYTERRGSPLLTNPARLGGSIATSNIDGSIATINSFFRWATCDAAAECMTRTCYMLEHILHRYITRAHKPASCRRFLISAARRKCGNFYAAIALRSVHVGCTFGHTVYATYWPPGTNLKIMLLMSAPKTLV